jgi:hypothetical protein
MARLFSDADCHCWRELGCTGVEGFHICIATSDHNFDNIHWDWRNPADGQTRGFCTYCPAVSVPHWLQAMRGAGVPASPFHLDLDARARRIMSLPSRAVLRAQRSLHHIKTRWTADKRRLAAMGLAGRALAQAYGARVRQEVDAVLDNVERGDASCSPPV